jgi:carboxylesterase type B
MAAYIASGLFIPYAPTVDGVEYAAHPTTLAAQGHFSNPVPVLLGSNENEGVLFNALAKNATSADLNALVSSLFGSAVAAAVLKAYPVRPLAAPWWSSAPRQLSSLCEACM